MMPQTLDATLNALNPLSYEFASLNWEGYYNTLRNIGPQEMSVIKHAWREVGLSRWLPEPPTTVRLRRGNRLVVVVSDEKAVLVCMVVHVLFAVGMQGVRLKMMCCAMMLVTRERVKARPRELYEGLYAWMRDVVCWHSFSCVDRHVPVVVSSIRRFACDGVAGPRVLAVHPACDRAGVHLARHLRRALGGH
jgi:hypothetical protein